MIRPNVISPNVISPNVTGLEVIRLEGARLFTIPNNIDNLSIKYKRKGMVFFGDLIFWGCGLLCCAPSGEITPSGKALSKHQTKTPNRNVT